MTKHPNARPHGLTPRFALTLIFLVIALVSSVFIGKLTVSPTDVLSSLLSKTNSNEVDAIVWGLRIPRTVLGFLAGHLLGWAGALTQLHARNPLADPGLLGVTSGSGLAVIIAMINSVPNVAIPWWALAGAILTGGIVLFAVSRISLFTHTTTLVLAGAIMSALLGALSTAMVLTHPTVMREFQGWSTGTLVGRSLTVVLPTIPLIILGVLLLLLNLPSWSSLELGDEVAANLGRNVRRDQMIGLFAVLLLAAAATTLIGPIAFLGLLAPHFSRFLMPRATVSRILLAGPLGALTLLTADVLGRFLGGAGELHVGVTIAILGAPMFILIARSQR